MRTIQNLITAITLVATGLFAAPSMRVNGTEADYATFHYYIDESAGGTDSVSVEFWPNDANVTTAELFSNLNRRDLATLYAPDASTIVAGDTTKYFGAYTMQNAGGGKWTLTLPIAKCGAYRMACRYKVSGDNSWRWYGKRDAALIISDVSTRDMIMYEVQVNAVDATGDGYSMRSTFADLYDNQRFNLDYVKSVGANTLWLMPFHPIGSRLDGNYGEVGSPYSIKNMWKVGEHLGKNGTRDGAMQEFKAFMASAEAKGVNILFDTIFNHTAKDAEVERDPVNPQQLAADPLAQMRYLKPNWYSKYSGNGTCTWNSDPGGSPPYEYWATASHAGQVGPAPADRHDFGKWCDTIDLFWGSYSALGNPQSTADGGWGASDDVKQMTAYYAHFFKYWMDETGNSIDGFRCDFAQGLPPQAWEYLINKAKSVKPELAFMAESLDGGDVSKRAGRQFDIINDSWVWGMMQGSGNALAVRNEIDSRKAAYGYAGVMRGIINHDQSAPANKWWTLSRYAVGAAIDGAPQMFMGQELGYTDHFGFSKWRFEYDRWIPQIRDYYNMKTLWNDTSGEKSALWNRYSEINNGRQRSQAIRLSEQYYLDQTSGYAHDQVFSVMKYSKYGWDAADQEVVLCFINLSPNTAQAGTFRVNVPAVYLNPSKLYNVRNLASSQPNKYLWGTARTGSDIAANGIYVGFSGNIYQEGSVAQFLKLEAIAPNPYQYNSMSVAGTINGWNLAANGMSKTSNGIWSTTITLYNASAVRLKFVANGSWAVNFGENNQSDKDIPVQGQFAEPSAADILINGALNGDYRFTFDEQDKSYAVEYLGGGVADSDNDGLPDDWEVQYFGNLAQDGDGDPDGDGKHNMTEYLAGWDPTAPNYLTNYSNLTVAGTFNGWNAGLKNMSIVADYAWQYVVTLTNVTAARFKFVANNSWAVNWGEQNQSVFVIPMNGVAEASAADVTCSATLNGTYKFTFNEQARSYSVTKVGGPPASNYSTLTVAGTFNGWNAGANNMTLVSDNAWQMDVALTNASAVRFKFTANGSWAANFGESNQSDFTEPMNGTAEAGNADITVSGTMSGTYRFTFNDATRAYSLSLLP